MCELILWPDGWGGAGAPNEPPPHEEGKAIPADVRDDQRSRSDALVTPPQFTPPARPGAD
jgi:hypothetical protein